MHVYLSLVIVQLASYHDSVHKQNFEGSQILQIRHSYEQGLITKEYMIVQCNFKFALEAYIASYPSTIIIHSLADYWSFVMNQHTHVAKL